MRAALLRTAPLLPRACLPPRGCPPHAPHPLRPRTVPPPQMSYAALARAAVARTGVPALQTAQQFLRTQLQFAESIFGPPGSYTPSATHVLLVAILIALLQRR